MLDPVVSQDSPLERSQMHIDFADFVSPPGRDLIKPRDAQAVQKRVKLGADAL